MSIKDKIGIKPRLRDEIDLRDKALAGDIVLVIDPETSTPLPTSTGWTSNVKISIETAGGLVHDWITTSQETILSIADTSSAGTASIAATTIALVNGLITVVVTGDAEVWDNADTWTLTVANMTLGGITVTGGTSVATFTAV